MQYSPSTNTSHYYRSKAPARGTVDIAGFPLDFLLVSNGCLLDVRGISAGFWRTTARFRYLAEIWDLGRSYSFVDQNIGWKYFGKYLWKKGYYPQWG